MQWGTRGDMLSFSCCFCCVFVKGGRRGGGGGWRRGARGEGEENPAAQFSLKNWAFLIDSGPQGGGLTPPMLQKPGFFVGLVGGWWGGFGGRSAGGAWGGSFGGAVLL